jgi:hypothetical protein
MNNDDICWDRRMSKAHPSMTGARYAVVADAMVFPAVREVHGDGRKVCVWRSKNG